MKNHCPSHKRFIPTCDECVRQNELAKETKSKKKSVKKTKEIDIKIRDIPKRKFEQCNITAEEWNNMSYYFTEMDKLGYKFECQIVIPSKVVILIFRRID